MIEVARYRVIFGDCDPMKIVYYGNYFRLFEIGRAELFRRIEPRRASRYAEDAEDATEQKLLDALGTMRYTAARRA